MRLPIRATLTVILTGLAVLAAACNGDATGDTPSGEATGETGYNDADITFLQGMIPHHEQAVEMALLVPDRTDREELGRLATGIIASQEAEISQMDQMLADAGASRDGDHAGHGAGMADGMMTEEQMDELADLDGTEFDLEFIDMMIEHHEGAVTSAEQVIDEGQSPQVRELAEGIIAEQEAEIEQMTTWREQWSTG